MTVGGIFYVDGGALQPMTETPYESEDLLQQLLVDFPAVLAGTVTVDERRRPLALVKRERGIPAAELGSDRFSIDHFFVDSAGVPVLVEVKRSTDTRIRREVVGQMLDYAANAVRYWSIDALRADFEETHAGSDDVLASFSEVGDADAFWSAVDRNLADGRIRMLFVADGFPAELVRVIEFLNEQMTLAEVLGIEIKQYVSPSGHRALVPRVVGATTAAERAKQTSTGRPKWNRTTMTAAATSDRELLEVVFNEAESASAELSWGSGQNPKLSVWRVVDGEPRPTWYLALSSAGEPALGIWRRDLTNKPGLDIVGDFFDQVATLPGFVRTFETHVAFPEASLAELGEAGVEKFFDVVRRWTA